MTRRYFYYFRPFSPFSGGGIIILFGHFDLFRRAVSLLLSAILGGNFLVVGHFSRFRYFFVIFSHFCHFRRAVFLVFSAILAFLPRAVFLFFSAILAFFGGRYFYYFPPFWQFSEVAAMCTRETPRPAGMGFVTYTPPPCFLSKQH